MIITYTARLKLDDADQIDELNISDTEVFENYVDHILQHAGIEVISSSSEESKNG